MKKFIVILIIVLLGISGSSKPQPETPLQNTHKVYIVRVFNDCGDIVYSGELR